MFLNSEDNNFQEINKAESKVNTILADIYKEHINIALWKRSLNKNVYNAAEQYIAKGNNISIVISSKNAKTLLSKNLHDFPLKKYLVEDFAYLVDMFCCLFDLNQVGLRLTILNKSMCPRFHVDHVPCRLITTYSGTGTEWLNNKDLNRDLLGKIDNPFINQECINIEKLAIGDVALLKGEAWIGNEGNGIVHRSPSIIDNKSRLLLTIDFA